MKWLEFYTVAYEVVETEGASIKVVIVIRGIFDCYAKR